MKIGLVYDLITTYVPNDKTAPDDSAELSYDFEVEDLRQTIEALGHDTIMIGDIKNLIDFIVTGQKVDLIFNYAVGKWGDTREAQVPALLEAYQMPYTGADPLSLSLCIDKALTKRLWIEKGLPTPNFILIANEDNINQLKDKEFEFPLLLKPSREGSSKGISNKSLVHNIDELKTHAKYLINTYNQPVLAEEFLPGKEYSVSVIGSRDNAKTIGAVEVTHGPRGYADYAEKMTWKKREEVFRSIKSPELKKELFELGLQAYLAVDCQEIGRLDIRKNKAGELNLIEINPNPSLKKKGCSLPTAAKLEGMSFNSLIEIIINQAIKKWHIE